MLSEIGRSEKLRIAIEVYAHRGAIGAVVDRNRKFFDWPEREIVCHGAIAGKVEAIIERHYVDAQAVERTTSNSQVFSQVCKLVTLMLQPAPDLIRGLANKLGYGRARMS